MKYNFNHVVVSFFQLLKLYFKRDSITILFYYPQHFNRGARGENYFFQPLLTACAKDNIQFLLVEEPDWDTPFPRNAKAIKFDFFFFLILALRKILPIKNNFEMREQLIGKIINTISFGKLKADVFITLSNSMGGVLRGINPTAELYDYQHGIISSNHPGYFCEDGYPVENVIVNKKKILVYGDGIKEIFKRNNIYYHDAVTTIGSPMDYGKSELYLNGRSISVSLQIVPESKDINYEQLRLVNQWIESNLSFIKENNINVYIRHHPRYNDCLDDSSLFVHEFVQDCTDGISFESLSKQTALHVTFCSTIAFEYAKHGIPTVFLFSNVFPTGKKYFLEDYHYPFFDKQGTREWEFLWESNLESRVVHAEAIRKWYNEYYQPFDFQTFLELVKRDVEKED